MASEEYRSELLKAFKAFKEADEAYQSVRDKITAFSRTGILEKITEEDFELFKKFKETEEHWLDIARRPY